MDYYKNNFLVINGIFDLIMVMLHLCTGLSWWSRFNISKDFLYFATLYGFIRVVLPNESNNNFIIKLTYLLECIYFANNGYLNLMTSVLCLIIAIFV